MTWTMAYNTVRHELQTATGKRFENLQKALKQAECRFSSWDIDKYVVISVEGYSCVAFAICPSEISRDVFPFDDIRVYPMQGVKIEPRFMTWSDFKDEETD